MRKESEKEGWLNPQAVYGYCLQRFIFPRQEGGNGYCLADYFASKQSGKIDVVAFQVVTIGAQATERFEGLQEAGEYAEAYYLHGLAVQMAEATADYLPIVGNAIPGGIPQYPN